MKPNYVHHVPDLPRGLKASFYAGAADLSSGRLPEVLSQLGAPCYLRQTHSNLVAEVVKQGFQMEGDAMFCKLNGMALCIQTADCVPVLLWNQNSIAAVHAGWRGLESRIITECVQKFGTPDGAIIGPCISGQNYETGEPVLNALREAGFPESIIRIKRPDKDHCNLRAAAEYELQLNGCVDIRHHDVCTFATEELPSYRRKGRAAGRLLSIIAKEG
jgi:hypothetical protein